MASVKRKSVRVRAQPDWMKLPRVSSRQQGWSLWVSLAPGEAALSGRGLLISGSWPTLLSSPGMGNRVGGGGTIVLQSETEILGCSKPPPDLASERQDTALSGGEALVKPPGRPPQIRLRRGLWVCSLTTHLPPATAPFRDAQESPALQGIPHALSPTVFADLASSV